MRITADEPFHERLDFIGSAFFACSCPSATHTFYLSETYRYKLFPSDVLEPASHSGKETAGSTGVASPSGANRN